MKDELGWYIDTNSPEPQYTNLDYQLSLIKRINKCFDELNYLIKPFIQK